MAKRRREPPISVRRLVVHEAGYMCANPACRYPGTLETHHIEYVSEGGGNEAENLLPLCGRCHTRHHTGEITTESIRAWKMVLVSLNEAFNRQAIDLLLALHRLEGIVGLPPEALINFAPLIASGLVEYKRWITSEHGIPSYALYNLTLSQHGKLYVEAWKAGKQEAALKLGNA